MILQHIELSKLKESSINVRKHGGDDVSDLVPSIRSLGVIQPLLVRPNCEGFEVIAGERRLKACRVVEQEDGRFDPVPCIILDSDDDAAAIEASLAENIARLPMDEIDQYKAFAALKAKGRSVADIAGEFGVTELLVKKRLAIANLITPVLDAYRKEEIDVATLRQLTLATKARQKEWYALFRDPEKRAPLGRNLKAWLFGGAEIPVSSALFAPDLYGGSIVSDLFGDERYFDDAQAFWNLQMEAVMQRQAAYLEDGWGDVVIMDIGQPFQRYDKVERGKDEGGKVYIECARGGQVEFHEGWLDEKEAARLDKAKARAEGGGKADAPAKLELTKAAIRYLALHRHNAVRAELLKTPTTAMRLMLAHLIAGSSLWHVQREAQNPEGSKPVAAAVAQSVESSNAQELIDAEREAVRELLGMPQGAGHARPDLCQVFARLLALPHEEVLRVLAFLMAETLEAGSAEVEALGHILEVDMGNWWAPDDVFFDLLRDKPAINAMVVEVAGKLTAGAYSSMTANYQKDIIKECLAGDKGRKKVENWKPRYMRFPMQPYTKRKGLPAVEQWKAVSKLFDKK